MRMIFSLFLILFSYSSTQAQILNVERKKLNVDSSNHFIGNVSVQFTVNNRSAAQDEPVNFLSATGNTNLIYNAKKHTYWAIGFANFFRVNDNPFIENRYLHLRANWLRKQIIWFYSFPFIEIIKCFIYTFYILIDPFFPY